MVLVGWAHGSFGPRALKVEPLLPRAPDDPSRALQRVHCASDRGQREHSLQGDVQITCSAGAAETVDMVGTDLSEPVHKRALELSALSAFSVAPSLPSTIPRQVVVTKEIGNVDKGTTLGLPAGVLARHLCRQGAPIAQQIDFRESFPLRRLQPTSACACETEISRADGVGHREDPALHHQHVHCFHDRMDLPQQNTPCLSVCTTELNR